MSHDASLTSEKPPTVNKKSKLICTQIAAWLVDNTSLTFNQIAQCCNVALEEVQSIADEEKDIEQYDPIVSGIITENDIKNCQKNPNNVPKLIAKNLKASRESISNNSGTISIARRRDKPNAIYYLIKKFPILDNNVIAKLVSTTSHTVEQIRNGSHHNMQNIKPKDPTLLGLCKQENLEVELEKADIEQEKQERLKNVAENT